MTNENQKPEEQVVEVPLPDFINHVIDVSICAPTIINPVYKINGDEKPELPKDN